MANRGLRSTLEAGLRVWSGEALRRQRQQLKEAERLVATEEWKQALPFFEQAMGGPSREWRLVARTHYVEGLIWLHDYRTALAVQNDLVESRTLRRGRNYRRKLIRRSERGSTLVQLGEIDHAIDELASVVDAMRRTKGVRPEILLQARLNLSVALFRIGHTKEALAEQEAILREAIQLSDDGLALDARGERAATMAGLDCLDEAIAEGQALAEAFAGFYGVRSSKTLQIRANLGASLAQAERLDEALTQLAQAIEGLDATVGEASGASILPRVNRAVTLVLRLHAADQRPEDYEAAIEALSDALARLEAHPDYGPRHWVTSWVRIDLGSLHSERDPAAAMRHVLTGLAAIDDYRYTFGDARDREAWRLNQGWVMREALDLAVRNGNGAIAAELIETARAQGVPALNLTRPSVIRDQNALSALAPPADVPAPASAPGGDVVFRAVAADAAEVPQRLIDRVARPARVGLGGRSALADAAAALRDSRTSPGDAPVISLDEICHDLVPDDGQPVVWWGTWVGGETLYQSVLVGNAHGWRVECCDPVPWHDDLEPLVAEAHRARTSFRTPLEEAELHWNVADRLLPPALLDVLGESEGKIWLCVAPAPELARIAFPLLPTRRPRPARAEVPDGAIDVERLIDRAIILHAPSATLMWAAARRRAALDPGQPERTDEHLSIVDPDGTLPRARPLADAVVLGPAGKPPATRDAVLAAAHALREGVLHIAAHAFSAQRKGAPSRRARPADAAIRLAEGTALSARDLYVADTLAIPARTAILACCSSSGAELESAEWLGLAPAVLWAGARAVHSTLWPIADAESAHEIEQFLAERPPGVHAAKHARGFQLRCVERWNARVGSFSFPADELAYITLVQPVLSDDSA